MYVFWATAPCDLAVRCQRFEEHTASIIRATFSCFVIKDSVSTYQPVDYPGGVQHVFLIHLIDVRFIITHLTPYTFAA